MICYYIKKQRVKCNNYITVLMPNIEKINCLQSIFIFHRALLCCCGVYKHAEVLLQTETASALPGPIYKSMSQPNKAYTVLVFLWAFLLLHLAMNTLQCWGLPLTFSMTQ